MSRKTAYTCNKEFSGAYGQVGGVIVAEATWLEYFERYANKLISSFDGSMMQSNWQGGLVNDLGLTPFEVCVLEPIRTIRE